MKHSRLVQGRLSTSSSRLVLAILLAACTLSAAPPARADDWQVNDEGDLQLALFNADFGDTITFETNVTLTANLPLVRTGNLTINGQGFTLSGNNQYRGLFVQSETDDGIVINVAINDLTITNATAQGGKGGDARFAVYGNPSHGGGGGGGAGLGGALFVGSFANVTLSNVNLQTNLARGGNGGAVGPDTSFDSGTSGGGGGYWFTGADGGNGGPNESGGGGAPDDAGGDGSQTDASPGGFGGGGGGSGWCYDDGDCPYIPGAGGFGGGSGGGSSGVVEPGGFGGGNGVSDFSGGGGGGAGFGGAIFVQEGGSLTLAGSLDISGNGVAGGDGGRKQGEGNATAGQGIGSGIFLHGDGSFTVAPSGGQTQTISDAIVDQTGVGGTGTDSGSWSLVKNGAGTTILTGANAYTGGTTVNAGILLGNTSSLKGNIANNASVIFSQAGDGTYAGNMSGSGALFKRGDGEVALMGTNTYTAGTRVEGGTLLVASDDKLGAAGTHIDFAGGGLHASGTFSSARPVRLFIGGGVFLVDEGKALTLSGVISGTGTLVKSGTGTLVLIGNSTNTDTTVHAGTLSVNGSIEGLTTVNTGGTLGGIGSLNTVIINGGGTLSPGNSIGTINIAENLVFGAGSAYAVEVSNAGAADRADVFGTADLSGGTVDVKFLAGSSVARSYTILNAGAGLLGTEFAGLDAPTLPGFVTRLAYDANNVYLVMATDRTDPDFVALNHNQLAVADEVLDHFDANDTLRAEFVGLDADGLSAASGEIAAGAIISGIDSADKFLAALDGQGEGGASGTEDAAGSVASYAEDDKVAGGGNFAALDMAASHAADPVDTAITRRWSAWGAAYGDTVKIGGDAAVGSHDTKANTVGLVGGASYRFDETLVGFALGGGWSNFSLADGLGSGDASTFNAGVYGRQGFGDAYLSGALAYGFHAVETNRSVLGDRLTGEFNAHTFSGRAEAGYRFETPVVAISPYAAFQAIAYHLPAYSETSSGSGAFALDYGSDTTTATRVELGARLDRAIALDGGARLKLSGRAAWAINGSTGRNFSAGFQSLPGTSFTIDGAEPDRNALLVDLGAEYNSSSGFFAAAAFRGEFSGNVESYSGKLKLGITW
ncbi:autotransporter outer membrane beta-barrel domain-containing protein [Mesorhizobium sp. LjRoot246]|uniref:autotransporter outer membrane beta-barrel domain-containing protein n=1 Tax=Mesorhizobium sp. LjRoot246 TaxID=3342294 RepID=UPI003ECE24E7